MGEQTAGVAEDDRLGHAEATDPSRAWLGERRFDDRRADDVDRHVAPRLHQRLLTERLRERVGIRPADARGAGASGFDELIRDPALAQLLGLGSQSGGSGGTELLGCFGAERAQLWGEAAGGLGVAADAARRCDLLAPVQTEVERAFADQFLRCVAAPVAGDVAGAHGDEVRGDAQRLQRLRDPRGAEQVDLDGRVERRVEGDGRRRMDDDVATGEQRLIALVEAETISADVAVDGLDAPHEHLVEGLAAARQFGLEPIEAVVLEDLASSAFGCAALCLHGSAARDRNRVHIAAAAPRERCRRSQWIR